MTACISSVRGLAKLPRGDFWAGLVCALAENAASVRIVDLTKESAQVLAEYTSGVAFGASGELRWAAREDGLQVVLIRDDGKKLPVPGKSDDILPLETDGVFLWGRWSRTQQMFFEDRIPRTISIGGSGPDLCYPEGTPIPKDQNRLQGLRRWYLLKRPRPEMTEHGVKWRCSDVRIWRWLEWRGGA